MKKPYVISISGGSSSGKSTFADNLAKKMNEYTVKIFHMDEYFKEKSERPVMEGIWNTKQYIDDNHPLTINLDAFHTDMNKAVSEDWDVIIIEGVFALWDKLIIPFCDLKLYVDCNSDERFARRVKRHLASGENLEEITERYIQAVQPRHMEYVEPGKWKADIILNGFLMPSLGYDLILTWVNKIVGTHPSL